MSQPNAIPEVYGAVISFALARGVKDIAHKPGCWEASIGERWWVAVNPHLEKTPCSHDVEIAPGDMYFEYNGWPAGFVGMNGGWLAAGEAANEEALLTELRKHTPTIPLAIL